VIWHACKVTAPSQLRAHDYCFDACRIAALKDFCVWNFVLPFDSGYMTETA